MTRRHSSAVIEGSFYTREGSDMLTAFKLASPIFRIAFRAAGMHSKGKFKRDTRLQKAFMTLNRKLARLPSVGEVTRYSISMPEVIPEGEWAPDKLFGDPPFLHPDAEAPSPGGAEAKEDEAFGDGTWVDVPLFVFRPKDAEPDEILPILIWYHGGGFCLGSIEDSIYQYICRRFCNKIRCVVVSVEYRLAPEYKFPVFLEDAYWTLLWVHRWGAELFHGDVSRIVVAGDSAGGSLSAITCILSKLRGGPSILHQCLIYPCLTDPCNDDYESQVAYRNGPLLTRAVMRWFMTQAFGESKVFSTFLPLAQPDEVLENLPPATIINAEHDPLRDHGAEYFRRLQGVNVPVRRTVYSKSIHGFFGTQFGESGEAIMEAVTALKEALAESANDSS